MLSRTAARGVFRSRQVSRARVARSTTGTTGAATSHASSSSSTKPEEEVLGDFWFEVIADVKPQIAGLHKPFMSALISGNNPPQMTEIEIATWLQVHPDEAHKIILRFQLGSAAGQLMATHRYTRKEIHQIVDIALDAVPPEDRPSLDLLPFAREHKEPDRS